MTSLGLGRSLPQHHTGTASTGTGLPSLGAGCGQGARSWHRAVLQTLARQLLGTARPPPPRLLGPAEMLISQQPHSFEGVYGFSVSPLSQAKITPFKGAAGPRVAGSLPTAGCSLAVYRLIYWESSLALCFS